MGGRVEAGWRVAILLTCTAVVVRAQSAGGPVDLARQVIVGEAEYQQIVQTPYMPSVLGLQVYAGKKTSVLDLDELPAVINNNYRQALAKTPGLLLSEESSPLLSVGYRGLNPHRVQFTQVLRDGIPIHADQFGYPEAYYTPPLDTVDRIEFTRGGGSLMYGPQPGGSLNYVTHGPRLDREFSLRTQHVMGSDDLYSTFSSVDGTVGRLGYYAFFNHRQSDGFRNSNSDQVLYNGSAKLVLDAKTDSRWVLGFDGYAEEHGEPGGLTFASGNNAVQYQVDRNAVSRPFDRFQLERYFGSLAWEKDFGEATMLTVTGWGGYYRRSSWRQTGGGFGILATGNANNIENQEFYTQGIEARIRHDWAWGENINTLAGGVQFYHTQSPRVDERGASPSASSGAVVRDADRDVFYAPVFVENRFAFGDLSVVPGLRLENVWQGVKENVNVDKTNAGTPLGDVRQYDFVPLAGLGMEYRLPHEVTPYVNFSQAYRPKIYTESVPTSGGAVANSDLNPGRSWQVDVGVRGQPRPWMYWDASLFWMDFDDQIGTVGSTVQNIGRTVHRGAELAVDVDLVGWVDALRGGSGRPGDHQFSLYGNAMLLDAEIRSGASAALIGNSPAHAPGRLVRAGGIYRWRDQGKVALLGTFVSDHFANDNNAANFRVPAYMVWDLTLQWRVYRDIVSVLGGVNNLFDEDYYSRIRPDGIDPAYRRNFYAGLSFAF
jgi:Fe(3+) dicitrate transport protein